MKLASKNFQCGHCLEPFYTKAEMIIHLSEISGEATCPHCYETNVSWFDDVRNERRLSRDAYDTSECAKN